MKILLFAPGFAPYAASENIVNSKLVLAMMRKGWHVDVVSKVDETPYYGDQWKEPWLPLRNITHEIAYPYCSAVRRIIERICDAVITGYPIAGIRWATRALNFGLKLHEKNHYQVILSRSTPDVAHLPAMLFSRETGLPWIANWNDPVKMPPPYGKGVSEKLGYIYESFLKKVSLSADYHSFPSERLQRYIMSYLPIGQDRSVVIPHIAGAYEPRSSNVISNTFTICHAGHLNDRRSPDTFLEGLSKFVQTENGRERVKFINIGLDNSGLKERAERFGVAAQLEITGPLSYLETLIRLRDSDLLLVVEAPCAEGIFLPSKFIDYVQTGRPILCVSPKAGTLHDILSVHGGGLAVPPGNAANVARALETFFTAWQQRELDSEFGSSRLYKKFAPAIVLDIYEALFSRLGLAA
jgi:glycosyltransferase involved in cell wall biosynthesis